MIANAHEATVQLPDFPQMDGCTPSVVCGIMCMHTTAIINEIDNRELVQERETKRANFSSLIPVHTGT